jgi:hypothetical protein
MPITDIAVTDIADFADGHEFGAAGAYVRIKGVARGTLDPAAPGNAGIADLDKAPRNARGLVDYATDFDILRPKDALRGSGILVYDVPNRGSKRIFTLLDDVAPTDPARNNDPKTKEDAGLGFLLGRGYSLVWSGWDPGAPRLNNNLGAEFPTALANGRPVIGRIRDEFHFGTRAPGDGSVRRLSYPAASPDQPQARLTVRARERDPRSEIVRETWEFIDDRSIRLLPAGRNFDPVKIYELWYEATGPKVLGIGYASVRDLVSFFRYRSADRGDTAGMGEIRHALAFGVSQSGRFLRHFLELGMNADDSGQIVFDGAPARSSPTTASACQAGPRPSTRTGSTRKTGSRSARPRRPTRFPAKTAPCRPAPRPTRRSSKPTARPNTGRRAPRWCISTRPEHPTSTCRRTPAPT